MTHGMTVVMLVFLGASAPLHPPDLQVEAATATGVALPELADAVARALVAGGARVVLRGPTSGSCEYCAKVTVAETGPGICRVVVSQGNHTASTTLHLPADSVLFDRARAIAIQAHLLVTWESSPEKPERKAREMAARPPRRGDVRGAEPSIPAQPQPVLAPLAPPPSAIATVEPSPNVVALPPSAPAASLPSPATSPPMVVYTPRDEARPQNRTSEPGPTLRVDAKPVEPVEATPTKDIEARMDSRPPEPRAAPSIRVAARRAAGSKPRWPWIPMAMGAGAGVAAGISALVARNRYDGLSDKTQPYGRAQSLKSSGESWQLASLILSGVAAAGLGVGIVGLATGSASPPTLTVAAAPAPSGGMVAIAGGLP